MTRDATERPTGPLWLFATALVLSLGMVSAIHAESARLIRDLTPGTEAWSLVESLHGFDDKILFEDGGEPWITDGTEAGTIWLRDITPGPEYSHIHVWFQLGDVVIFPAIDGTSGGSIWRTDGTVAGTVLVKDICPTCHPVAPGPRMLGQAGGRVFFLGWNNTAGGEPWVTDGTPAGTHMVADIFPGFPTSDIFYAAALDGRLLFGADDGVHGSELWITEPDGNGAHIVADIRSGPEGSAPRYLFTVGDAVYFQASDGSVPGALWRSDGTAAGTRKVSDVTVGDVVGSFQGQLVFRGRGAATGYELWISDGTAAGTRMVADINPGPESSLPAGFVEWRGGLYFQADDGVHGYELWRSDGSASGTTMVADLWPGVGASRPGGFTAYGDHLWFTAEDYHDAPYGGGLWRTDGTASGTELMEAPDPGEQSPFVWSLATAGEWLFFSARSQYSGRELWKTRGPAGTAEQVVGTALPRSSRISKPVMVGDRALFTAGDGQSDYDKLWAYADGRGAYQVTDLDAGFQVIRGTTSLGPVGYFDATTPESGFELWRSDGTSAGTVRVADINPGARDSDPAALTPVGQRLFFTASDGFDLHGRELWVTDGTEANTRMVRDIGWGSGSSYAEELTAVGDSLFFYARVATTEPSQLWFSDGTAGGTYAATEMYVFPELSSALGRLFFCADGGYSGLEPWATLPGAPHHLYMLADVNPGQGGTNVEWFVEVNGRVIFKISGASQLWASDGSPRGTSQVWDWPVASSMAEPTVVGPVVFFSFDDGVHGRELWLSDGTQEGTLLVRDIRPGSRGSAPTGLTAGNGRIWFAADDGTSGVEVWTSDGTTEGTRLAADIAPGSFSSMPSRIAAVGDGVLVVANDIVHGSELWGVGLWLFADGFESSGTGAWSVVVGN